MKKLLSVTMSIVIMLSCMIFTVPAQAATQIKENQTVEVVFQRNTSLKQTFTYTMPAGGYFYIRLFQSIRFFMILMAYLIMTQDCIYRKQS